MEQISLEIGTIGQKLETARQVKGVTVSEAGRATKILSKFIEAMECDDFGALSAPVYAKSFIKMYAKYLGIESKPLVDEYVQQYAPKMTRPLGDEVFQKLEPVSKESSLIAKEDRPSVFGQLNPTTSTTSSRSSQFPLKKVLIVGGIGIILLLILLSVPECSSDDDPAPAPAGSGAVVSERPLLIENAPDVFLVKPGKIKVEE